MTSQEEVKYLLRLYGIRQNWLAHQIGVKPQTLSYMLNESKKIDNDLLKLIKEVINSYQYEQELFNHRFDDNYDLFDDEKLRIGIGGRIRIFAKRKYGTLKKLANAMNISPQQLQQYISGKREPGSRILIKLLKLGCDINWLLSGTESLESFKIDKLEREFRKLQDTLSHISNLVKK
ncbi:helix-turn-helix protein [bacterium BMS3Abin04]|nr:helix-turn-helix protein [bacterium BMS3Abin04]